jgi:hypothetical protein
VFIAFAGDEGTVPDFYLFPELAFNNPVKHSCNGRFLAEDDRSIFGVAGWHNRIRDQLDNVHNLHLSLFAEILHAILEHGHTERTGDTSRFNTGFESLTGTIYIDSFIAEFFLEPHPSATSPTAETPPETSTHLSDIHTNRFEDVPGWHVE